MQNSNHEIHNDNVHGAVEAARWGLVGAGLLAILAGGCALDVSDPDIASTDQVPSRLPELSVVDREAPCHGIARERTGVPRGHAGALPRSSPDPRRRPAATSAAATRPGWLATDRRGPRFPRLQRCSSATPRQGCRMNGQILVAGD